MKENNRVLVIDDDRNIFKLMKLYLEKEGYDVIGAFRGDEGVEACKANDPTLVILDVMLPGMEGWQVCREIRAFSEVPIIMLTAKGETFDKVLGLELGADDYMVKPFDPKELLARVKAVVRRAHRADDEQALAFPGLNVNMSNYSVTYHGQEIEMPPKEIELLHFLASHANKVFTREELLEQVWGFDFFGDSRTVDVHVKRIREKLTGNDDTFAIKTVWGVGYKFDVRVKE